MTHTIDGAVITPDIILTLKEFQHGHEDWLLEMIDQAVEILIENRDVYDAQELLEIMAGFRTINRYINNLKAGGKNE